VNGAFESLASPQAVALFTRALVACGLIVLAGFAIRRQLAATHGGVIPDEGFTVRNVVEVIVEALTGLARQTMGPEWRRWFPFVGTIFLFVLVANLMGLIPGVGGATSDVNTTTAWAIISFCLYQYVGIRAHGWKYIIKYMGPSFATWHVAGRHIHVRALAPLFLILEIPLDFARIGTLSIRLLANMFADHTVVGVFLSMVPLAIPAVFIGLGMVVCVLQAFVFSLLTMVYINLALQEAH
jgi:F-type H+-transporting ATPase subunit a